MWVIFLLSALMVAVVTLIIIYIGHRVIMTIENERENNKIKNKKRGNKK
jgi:predicted membrane protein